MKIQLGGARGGYALVSKKDYNNVSQYKWHMTEDGYVRGMVNKKSIRMHRFILDAPANVLVDHINGITYDNRRSNLRLSSSLKNSQNRRKKTNTSSKYRYVTFNTIQNKYRARIVLNKKDIYLGMHDEEINAAEAVDMFLVHNPDNDHIKLNFPKKKKKYRKRKYIPYASKKFNKTIYRGITKRIYGYSVTIRINKKNIIIGTRKNLVDAAKLWDKYVIDNKIPHRKLNFPNDYPDYNFYTIKTHYEIVDDKTIRLINDNLIDEDVLIDKEDYYKVKYYVWNINRKYVSGYVNGEDIRLHRYLLNVSDPIVYVDHINNNRLDNTRSNLRLSNAVKNGRNCKKRLNTKSKYFGLYYNGKKWDSCVVYNGKQIYIGRDANEIYAARHRDLYILDNFPDEHYKLNFEWQNSDISKWKNLLNFSSTNFYDKINKKFKYAIYSLIDHNITKLGKMEKFLKNKIKERDVHEAKIIHLKINEIKERDTYDTKIIHFDKINEKYINAMHSLIDHDITKLGKMEKLLKNKINERHAYEATLIN